MQLDKLEVHVDGVAELGLALFDGTELGRFPGVAPGRTRRPGSRVSHSADHIHNSR
jgi:hypothetical protein